MISLDTASVSLSFNLSSIKIQMSDFMNKKCAFMTNLISLCLDIVFT